MASLVISDDKSTTSTTETIATTSSFSGSSDALNDIVYGQI